MEDDKLPIDTSLLRRAGLTESQAKGYLALIQHKKLSPVELAEITNESRTNGYMIAEKLEKLGLAVKNEGKKMLYSATHPTNLEALAEKRRKVLVRNEQIVKQGISPLIDMFYQFREEPGARTLQGIEGIKEVYADTLRTKADIFLLRTTADTVDLGLDYLNNYRQKRADLGINTYALTPDTKIARHYRDSGEDEQMLFHRTMLPNNSYSAPVEIDIYGNKVAFISYGETQMATIITSPPIAEAMRQLFQMLAKQFA